MSTYIDSNGECSSQDIVLAARGNTVCRKQNSRGGSGGYISGIIKIFESTTAFLTIGGRGIHSFIIPEANSDACYYPQNMVPGGYGGGGYAANWHFISENSGAWSGGGQIVM